MRLWFACKNDKWGPSEGSNSLFFSSLLPTANDIKNFPFPFQFSAFSLHLIFKSLKPTAQLESTHNCKSMSLSTAVVSLSLHNTNHISIQFTPHLFHYANMTPIPMIKIDQWGYLHASDNVDHQVKAQKILSNAITHSLHSISSLHACMWR
jgi:hypothetical protein